MSVRRILAGVVLMGAFAIRLEHDWPWYCGFAWFLVAWLLYDIKEGS